ncbi:Glucosaminyl phosphatidylinositol (GlcN-PI) nositol acylation protein [Sorochytrium milnesiophthora]
MDETAKRSKEAFVSGHSGTTTGELTALLLTCVLSYATAQLLSKPRHDRWARLMVELTLLMGPPCFTICYANHVIGTVIALQTCVLVVLIIFRRGRQPAKAQPAPSAKTATTVAKTWISYVTVYRTYLMLLTVFSILAVDFVIFPRRFAKTEMYGVGLMDLGVGSFVFSNAVVGGVASQQNRSPTFGKALRQALPLGALGVARMIATKGINYQEHVSEYGTHWNFFFTLASLPLLVALAGRAVPVRHPLAVAAIVGVAHQCLLQWAGDDYIANAPRTNLVNSNREGLLSLPGYLSLYLTGVWSGAALTRIRTSKTSAVQLLGFLLFSWAAYGALPLLGLQPSRRTANPTFVVWTAATNVLLLLLFAAVDVGLLPNVCRAAPQPMQLLEAVNLNQLTVFLVANLLTGAVNMSIDTLAVSDLQAGAILAAYTTAVAVLAGMLYFGGTRIKL